MPAVPGKGSAYKYIPESAPDSRFSRSGGPQNQAAKAKAAMSARFNESRPGQGLGEDNNMFIPSVTATEDADEASKIAAMFQASSEQWSQAQERMAHAPFRSFGRGGMRGGRGGGAAGGGRPDSSASGPSALTAERHHEPPGPGYVCHRCGQKGHWIQDCPTNDNPEFQSMPKLKRTTGIPRSMLKTIENPTDEQRAAGVMITADGEFVIPQADTATWEKEKGQHKILTKNDVYEMAPSDPSLTCSLCSCLLRDAMETPCCHTRFCEECITTHLLDHDFACPECDTRIDDFDQLLRDEATRTKVRVYIDEEIAKSEQAHDKDNQETEAEMQGERGRDGAKGRVDSKNSNNAKTSSARNYAGSETKDAKTKRAELMWSGGVPWPLMMQLLMARLAQAGKDNSKPDHERVQSVVSLRMLQLQMMQRQQAVQAQAQAQAQYQAQVQAQVHAQAVAGSGSRWNSPMGAGYGGGAYGGSGAHTNGHDSAGNTPMGRWGQVKRDRPADFLEVPRAVKRSR